MTTELLEAIKQFVDDDKMDPFSDGWLAVVRAIKNDPSSVQHADAQHFLVSALSPTSSQQIQSDCARLLKEAKFTANSELAVLLIEVALHSEHARLLMINQSPELLQSGTVAKKFEEVASRSAEGMLVVLEICLKASVSVESWLPKLGELLTGDDLLASTVAFQLLSEISSKDWILPFFERYQLPASPDMFRMAASLIEAHKEPAVDLFLSSHIALAKSKIQEDPLDEFPVVEAAITLLEATGLVRFDRQVCSALARFLTLPRGSSHEPYKARALHCFAAWAAANPEGFDETFRPNLEHVFSSLAKEMPGDVRWAAYRLLTEVARLFAVTSLPRCANFFLDRRTDATDQGRKWKLTMVQRLLAERGADIGEELQGRLRHYLRDGLYAPSSREAKVDTL